MATNSHSWWPTCQLQCHSKNSCGDIWPPAYLLSSSCFCWQQPKVSIRSPANACLYELWIWQSNPLCNLHCNRAFKGGIWHIFVAAVYIKLNVGESWVITALRKISHHWPALYYFWWSHPWIEAIFLSIKTWEIELITFAMDESPMTTLINLQHTTAPQWERRCTQKPSWREKADV